MRLGIFAPYNRSESTAMAIRLAFTALRAGWTVKWLAPCRSNHVHPFWDDQVRLATAGRMPEWARKSDCRVWFSVDSRLFRIAQSSNRGQSIHDILVPSWHSMTAQDAKAVGGFGAIVCPNRPMMRALESVFGRQEAFRVCDWPSGIKSTLRHGFLDHTKPRALFVADAYSARRHGYDLLLAVQRILDALPTLHASLSMDFAPDRRESVMLRDMLARYEDRLAAGLRVGADTMLAQIHASDWLIDTSVRHSSGLLVCQARAMGVPPVTWRVSPMDGVVCDDLARGRDGVLIDCDRVTTACGAETAVWDTDALVNRCVDVLSDPHKLIRKQTYSFRRAEFSDVMAFQSFWLEALEVHPVS